MNRTDRLYALVEELRAVAPRPRSARQLAGRYEVSTRTIERDILALQESGVPVADVAGTAGQAEQLGGKVVVAPNKLDDGMVVAYLTDPHGSMFALFSPEPAS